MVTKFTRHEFARACGVDNNSLTVYAQRGKLAINSSRCEKCENKKKPCNNCKALEFIDLNYRSPSGFYINMDFFKKNTEGIAPVKISKLKPPVKKDRSASSISVPVIINSEHKNSLPEQPIESELSENSSEAALTRAAKYYGILDKQAATRLKELEEARLKGELIPVDIVRDIIQYLGENQKRAYSDAAENLIMIISERLQAQEHDKAFMRAKLIEGMNRAINQSVNESQERLNDIQGDTEKTA